MTVTEEQLNHAWVLAREFQPGLYEHYKGGRYVALGLLRHHDTGMPMVEYLSLTYGNRNVRPLVGWDLDPDGWLGSIDSAGERPRFKWVGDLPTTIPWNERQIP